MLEFDFDESTPFAVVCASMVSCHVSEQCHFQDYSGDKIIDDNINDLFCSFRFQFEKNFISEKEL